MPPLPTLPRDILSKLAPVSFKGIQFPVSSFKTSFSQDLAIHKFPNVDGARVENTGRNPMVFDVQAHFRNNLWTGPKENWSNLYPETYVKFIKACSQPTSGELIHPLLGKWQVQVQNGHSAIESNKRDGEDVEISFIETIESDSDATRVSELSNPLADAIATSASLDVEIKTINIPAAQKPSFSFEDLTRQLTGVVDSASLLQKQVMGKIANIHYQLDKLSDSLERANDTGVASAKLLIERLKADLNAMNLSVTSRKPIGVYLTQQSTTLARLASQLKGNLSDLASLNPDWIKVTLIPAKTIIRFYKPSTIDKYIK